jgi:hypothetical protein
MLIVTRLQGDERADVWLNTEHILVVNTVPAGAQAKSSIQLMGVQSSLFVAESPEELEALVNREAVPTARRVTNTKRNGSS